MIELYPYLSIYAYLCYPRFYLQIKSWDIELLWWLKISIWNRYRSKTYSLPPVYGRRGKYFSKLGQNPLNYKSALLMSRGHQSIRSQFLNQHCSLLMFAHKRYCFSYAVGIWTRTVQRFMCENKYVYSKLFGQIFRVYCFSKKCCTKNLRHLKNMFEMWSFTNEQVEQFGIIVVKNSRILFWKTDGIMKRVDYNWISR